MNKTSKNYDIWLKIYQTAVTLLFGLIVYFAKQQISNYYRLNENMLYKVEQLNSNVDSVTMKLYTLTLHINTVHKYEINSNTENIKTNTRNINLNTIEINNVNEKLNHNTHVIEQLSNKIL